MIRYTLACDGGHRFESWFPSSDAYDEQAQRGLVACPVCDAREIVKVPMAPALARGSRRERDAAPAQPQGEVAMIGEPERRLRAMLRTMQEYVKATAENVGPRFASEARAMHYGDEPHRSIYGKASVYEARALVEEGIDVCPLPPMPDDRN